MVGLRATFACAALLLSHSPCAGQWLFSIYAGASHTAATGIRLVQPTRGTDLTFPEVPFDGESWRSPIYYGYRIARRVSARRLYLEAEFIHAKIYARQTDAPHGSGSRNGGAVSQVPFQEVVGAFAMSHGLNFILANAVFRQPLRGDRLTLLLRGGAGPMLPHVETVVEGERMERYEWAGVGVHGAAGIDLRLSRHVSAIVEYKLTRAHLDAMVPNGSVRLSPTSHHVAFGLGATF